VSDTEPKCGALAVVVACIIIWLCFLTFLFLRGCKQEPVTDFGFNFGVVEEPVHNGSQPLRRARCSCLRATFPGPQGRNVSDSLVGESAAREAVSVKQVPEIL
jgi:hypothetical protein